MWYADFRKWSLGGPIRTKCVRITNNVDNPDSVAPYSCLRICEDVDAEDLGRERELAVH